MAEIISPEEFDHPIPNDAVEELIGWMVAVMDWIVCQNNIISNMNQRILTLENEIKYGSDTGSG